MPLFIFCMVWVTLTTQIHAESNDYQGFMWSNGLLSSDTTPVKNPMKGWPCTSVEHMLDTFVPNTMEAAKYVVNVGAQYGDQHDPAYSLHKDKQYAGLLFEGNKDCFPQLDATMQAVNQSGNIRIHHDFVYPDTITEHFKTYSVPKDFGFLKVDIDSLDLGVTRQILKAGYSPGIVMVEINPDVPPALSYELVSLGPLEAGQAKRKIGLHDHGGTSASAVFNTLSEYDYALIGVELGSRRGKCKLCEHNMYFAKGSLFRKALPQTPVPTFAEMSVAYWQAMHVYHRGKGMGCIGNYRRFCPVSVMMKRYCELKPQICSVAGHFRSAQSFADMDMFYHQNSEEARAAVKLVCDEAVRPHFIGGDVIRCEQG